MLSTACFELWQRSLFLCHSALSEHKRREASASREEGLVRLIICFCCLIQSLEIYTCNKDLTDLFPLFNSWPRSVALCFLGSVMCSPSCFALIEGPCQNQVSGACTLCRIKNVPQAQYMDFIFQVCGFCRLH